MNTYVVKNTDNFPVLLRFPNGKKLRLRPNGLHIWQGLEQNLEFLQDHVNGGKLDVIVYYGLGPLLRYSKLIMEPSEWLREGF